ncbi:hypothetical protein GQ53DRAFT_791898 [Thozetella sp. PMI_491]|nr:hypothetical protein GQ53DRAFT_791898 [Thozetella sp. PMI_491]
MNTTGQADGIEPFAIVGMAFKMPQEAVNETSFWEVLEARKNLMTEWPENRANVDCFYDGGSKKPNTLHGRGAHFVKEDPAVFDAPFFSISPQEAAAMDPQQRWALEASYHALENAGIPVESVRGSRTAVYASSFSDDYARILAKDPDSAPRYTGIGTACSIVANRISWYFNLRGPSVHVDTACSSGLVALDMACQSMRCGDSSAALVVGSTLLLSPELTTLLANMGFLSPDSRCFSFDARGNGFARGEGVVALVVKPLSDALRNGDVIRAVVRATAANQDGRTPGLTQPSAEAQESLIRHVYAKAGLGFGQTRYFEAHGTGTAIGDPIEMKAIGRVFRSSRSPKDPLYVGSVKANIGHLEPASGLAGIVKCIIVLEKGIIPPNALFEKLNPDIDAEFFNLEVPTKSIPWPSLGPRRASVNSFGFGGTNAHVILDDALHYLRSRNLVGYHHGVDVPAAPNGITLRTGKAEAEELAAVEQKVCQTQYAAGAQRITDAYQDYYRERIVGNPEKLGQLSYTLAARRSMMPWRTFAVQDPAENEDQPSLDTTKPVRSSVEKKSIAFVFTGQGAQYAGMGMDLNKSDEILASLGCQWSIFDVILSADKIHNPEVSQPLCTALQIGLIQLLRTFGVVPAAACGHSSGEIAAAYTVGALSHSSACKVAYYRGQVAEKLRNASVSQPGAMMSVNLAESQVADFLARWGVQKGTVHVACVNSPTNVTLSGPSDSLDIIKVHLDEVGIFAQKVNTGVAYHSPAMLAVSSEYLELMGSLEMGSDGSARLIPMVSSVTGQIAMTAALANPQYWVDNLLSPVRFVDVVQRLGGGASSLTLPLGAGPLTDLIEVGPHPALRRPVRDSIASRLSYHCVLEREKSPLKTALELLGKLFCEGHNVSVLAGNSQDDGKLPFLVDCPPYPFDHSMRFWTESRISKSHRFRPHISGHLLGRRAHDWNPLQPRWRNWLSTETMPWLTDHMVNGNAICPGTGLLVMTLEAARQEALAKSKPISGFLLKNTHFIAPIIVPETIDDAIETIVELRPVQNVYEKESTRSEVCIFSFVDGTWKLCFRTQVEVQHEETNPLTPIWADETRREHVRIRKLVESATASCSRQIDRHSFYTYCEERGLMYGPSFQLLSSIGWDGQDSSTAQIETALVDRFFETVDSPVHPAVLDAILHLLVAQASHGLAETIPTFVPSKISSAWISSKIWSEATSSIRVYSYGNANNNLLYTSGDLYAIDDDGSPLCAIQGVEMTQVSLAIHQADDAADHTLLHSIDWKPQLSSLSPLELRKLCEANTPIREETMMEVFHPKLESAMRMSARAALKVIRQEEVDSAPGYIKKYIESLRHQFGAPEGEDLSGAALESLLQECELEQPAWRMFPAVARALPSIIRGETNALELLFSSKAAEDFYAHGFGSLARDERLHLFLDLATHENPGMKILEVGAGTGSMTRSVLAALQGIERETGQTRFAEYTYTDISPSFFEEAREKFKDFEDRMIFKTLDLETDLKQQGYQESSYDMVLAGSVLHVTSDLVATLKKVNSLLRPHGHLVFLEIVTLDSACATVGFGSLEGWWFGTEEWRQYGPLATEERWDDLLRESGFSGVDFSMRDYKSDICHLISTMVSTVQKEPPKEISDGKNEQEIIFLVDPTSKLQYDLAAELGEVHRNTRTMALAQVDEQYKATETSAIVVSLLEVGIPQLSALEEVTFHAVRSHIQAAQNMIWVSSSSGSNDPADARFSLATGLFRSLRNEHDNKHMVTLCIESGTPGCEASFVSQILYSCFLDEFPCTDIEFVARGDCLTVGRIREELKLDAERISRVRPSIISEPWESGPPLALEIGTPGMLDTLRFAEDTARDLAPHEVEIKAAVWPISFRDIFIALGRLGNEPLGFECAGTVTRVGSDCTERFSPGERVLMVSVGCMRSHPRAPVDAVFKLPDELSFHDAVAGINPGITAWYAISHIARLQPGEKILIHSAAGSTGQMAVKIAKLLGAEVFATVGSEEKKQLVTDPNGLAIPESHVFYSRNTSFAKGIMRQTDGYGVDVVLNSLSGVGLLATWECIAPYGRFIDIGKSDIMANTPLPMGRFAKNVSFSSVDLHYIVVNNKRLTRQLVEKILRLAANKEVGVPKPLHLFPVSQAENALRYMQSGKNTGRILITLNAEDVVPKYLVHKSTWRFDANASYLIAGGMGGLGRPIIRWMADRGAGNFIVPSRSGGSSQAALELISDLGKKGVTLVAPCCDVSSAVELETILQECASMPPIKGCMNLAMVLQDAVFENMTHAQWTQTLRAKVDSSWNLHQLLPKDMDFFILMASLSGIYGSASQGNYSAANNFLDSLARMRATVGGYGTSMSFDLGWMQNIGIVAERADYRRMRETVQDMVPIQAEDLIALLEHYCDPSLAPPGPEQSQLLIGINTPAHFHARGQQPPAHFARPLFSPFDVALPHGTEGKNAGTGILAEDTTQRFRKATGVKERGTIVVEALKNKLSHALRVQIEDIDQRKRLSDYGVDSLMAVELRNWIWRNFRASVALFEIMGESDIKGVGRLVAEKAE